MKEKIEEFKNLEQVLIKELKEYVKDQTIPLESRWDLFISSNLGYNQGYYLELKSYNLERFYDRSWVERHSTVYPERVFDYIYDYELEDCEEGDDDYAELKAELEVTINTIKEELLSLFIKSWEFDW